MDIAGMSPVVGLLGEALTRVFGGAMPLIRAYG
jgi:hypothetical protein